MKKRYGLVALGLMGLLLASCGEVDNSSSTKPTTPTTDKSTDSGNKDSSSSETYYEEEDLLAKYFNSMGSGTSFTVSYLNTDTGVKILDYFTESYVYFSSDDLGYALMEDGSERHPYCFQLDDDKGVILGLAQSEDDVSSLVSYTYVKYLTDRGFAGSDFEAQGGGYHTDNAYLIYAMCGLSGWGSYASYFTGVTFELDDGDSEVDFVLEMDDAYSSKIPERYRSGSIFNIGTTALDEVEDFLDSYKIPSKTATTDQLSLFLEETFESNTTSTLVSSSGERTSVGTYSLKYTGSKYELTQSYGGFDRTMYYEKKTVIENGIPQDSVGERTYIDHSNQVQSVESTTKWNAITSSLAVNVIEDEMSNIRVNDDGSFMYAGASCDTLFASLTQFSPQYDLSSISFKVEDGKVVGLVATTFPYDFQSNGSLEVMEYSIDLSKNPNEPTKPVSYENSSQDKATIEKAFGFFSNPTTSFKLSVREYSPTLNYSMYYEGIYDKTNSIYYYHENGDTLGSGFFERDDKIYGYTIDSSGTAKVIAPSIDGHLYDTTTYSISSDCFELDDGVIRDRDIGLDNPLDYMFVGESQVADGYEGTGIKMTLNSSGLIDTVLYTSYVVNPANGSYYPIYVQYTYSYGDSIAVDSTISNKLSGLDYVKPTKWSEETVVVPAQVRALVGDDSFDVDSALPYVYRDWLTTNWFGDYNSTTKTVNIHIYLGTDLTSVSDSDKAQFYVDFIAALKTYGYSETSNDSDSGTVVLSKDGVPFTITVNTKDYKFSSPIVLTLKE